MTISRQFAKFEDNKVDGTTYNRDIDVLFRYCNVIAPPGAMISYGGASAPTGWVLCDGTAISRTVYKDLFNAVGTTYGVGDGSTTFNVPDLKDKIPMGKSGTKALGTTGGAATANLAHTHAVDSHSHSGVTGASSANYQSVYFRADPIQNVPSVDHTHTVSAQAPGTDSKLSATQSILNPYVTINWIIKY